jgi:hypothetical protein
MEGCIKKFSDLESKKVWLFKKTSEFENTTLHRVDSP